MTSFTRLPVVGGPGVNSSGSPVSEAAGLIFMKNLVLISHIISQIRANVPRFCSGRKPLWCRSPLLPEHPMAASDYEVFDERFRNCVNRTSHVEKLWSGARWTEGPVYFPAGKYVLFSDIPNDRIMRYDETDGSVSVFRHPAGNANGHTVDRHGRLVSCEHGNRRVTRTEIDGRITVIADSFEGKRLNSPNDVVVKSDDSIWFTDPPYGRS